LKWRDWLRGAFRRFGWLDRRRERRRWLHRNSELVREANAEREREMLKIYLVRDW